MQTRGRATSMAIRGAGSWFPTAKKVTDGLGRESGPSSR
jgi:hypothetical protein